MKFETKEKKEKRKKRIYGIRSSLESIFTESKNLTKDEYYQLIANQNNKDELNLKLLDFIEKRE
ncbi:hypothetical protein [Enterococcus faecalis]|uniref:hypothetical protein n=1 Tax=Enterococcus faecalis TaxID=1351 RepID=UPI003CC66A4D